MHPCEIRQEPSRHTLSVRFRAPVAELPRRFGEVYGAIAAYLDELGDRPAGAPFATYYNMDMQALDVEAGFPVAKHIAGRGDIRPGELSAGTFAVCHYTGPYDGTAAAYEALAQFSAEQGYTPSGIAYEWYLTEPDAPPEELRTDVAFPVVRAGETAR